MTTKYLSNIWLVPAALISSIVLANSLIGFSLPVRSGETGISTVRSFAPVIASISQSQGGEKDGLIVVAEPIKETFSPSEPLAFKIIYRNVSKQALRLPDQPALYNFWLLTLEDVSTHMTYTGGTTLPTGGASIARPSAAIQPGDSLTATVSFMQYGFIAGTLDYAAFGSAKFQSAVAGRGNAQPPSNNLMSALKPGNYKVSVNIRFPARSNPDSNPTPIWKDNAIVTSPVEIKIVP